MKRQHDALHKENEELKEKIQELNLNDNEKRKIEEELQNERSKVQALHQNNKSLEEERDKILADKLDLEKDLEKLQGKLATPAQKALLRKTEKHINEYQSKLKELESMKRKIACLTTENSTLKSRLSDLWRRYQLK